MNNKTYTPVDNDTCTTVLLNLITKAYTLARIWIQHSAKLYVRNDDLSSATINSRTIEWVRCTVAHFSELYILNWPQPYKTYSTAHQQLDLPLSCLS